jgi:Predicted O-methyltransferase
LNTLKIIILYSRIWRDFFAILGGNQCCSRKELFREARSGSIKPSDAIIVAKLLQQQKPNRILEIGSFLGVSTRLLLDVSLPWSAQVTAIDPNIPHRIFDEPGYFVKEMTSAHKKCRLEIVTAFFGKPLRKPPVAVPVIDATWGRTFDLVYIDGDHSYEAVADNFRLALTMLASGGTVLFHDALSWPDVRRFLEEIKEEFKHCAEVSILGESDRKLLKYIGRSNDGIGYFRLL